MLKKNEPPYYLIHRNGKTHEFSDMEKLHCFVRESGGTIGPSHKVRSKRHRPDGVYAIDEYDWTVRDALGNRIKNSSEPDLRRNVRRPWRWHNYSIHQAAFSNGQPVPGTGRCSGGHYHRRPAQLGIARSHAGFMCDLRNDESMLPWNERGQRDRMHTPPNAWDDAYIASLRNRNWKKFRRTRWK